MEKGLEEYRFQRQQLLQERLGKDGKVMSTSGW